MKKLLTIFAAFGITASAAAPAVACGNSPISNKEVAKKINELAKTKKPQTKAELDAITADFNSLSFEVYDEILADIIDEYDPETWENREFTDEEKKAFMNHFKAPLYFAFTILDEHKDALEYILRDENESPEISDVQNARKCASWIFLFTKDKVDIQGDIFKPTAELKAMAQDFFNDIDPKIKALEGKG